jgi:hypothetical protein
MKSKAKTCAPLKQPVEPLTYTATEACEALGVSRTTLWRLERRGLIAAITGLRKRYSRERIARIVDAGDTHQREALATAGRRNGLSDAAIAAVFGHAPEMTCMHYNQSNPDDRSDSRCR